MATSLTIFIRDGYPTYSSCVIDVSFTVTYAASYKTRFDLYQNGSLVSTSWGSTYALPAGGSKDNLRKTFNGLLPDTDYEIVAELYNATTNAGLGITDAVSFTTESEPAPERPANWQWSSTVAVNAAVPVTQAADGTYLAKYLTAAEWDGFIARCIAFAKYLGMSVSGTQQSTTPGTEMDADQINTVIDLLTVMAPPTAPPAKVSPGDVISAATINGLKNSLNSIP